MGRGDNCQRSKQVDAEHRSVQAKSVKRGRAAGSGWAVSL